MRTTINIDGYLLRELKAAAEKQGIPLCQALNRCLAAGLKALQRPHGKPQPFKARTYTLGVPRIPLVKALQAAAAIEDEESSRKLELRK